MKKVFIVMLLLSTFVFAQGSFRLNGGINMGNIQWNDSEMHDQVDPQPIIGIDAGLEKAFSSLILGVHYVQRGMQTEDFIIDNVDMTLTMNYVNGYALVSIGSPESTFSLFLGGEVGKYLNGETTQEYDGESNSEEIDAENINIDYGAVAGAYLWLSKRIGLRGSYYYGLSDIDDVEDVDLTGKHNGIQIQLSYRL
ncbi:MAG: PorT family protein [Candidatus Marinimicrobia bacterium]|nr:PorT family protein [Candidatus Neomarinimicrobiota bacterium]